MVDSSRTPCIVGVGTTAFADLYRNLDPERLDYDLALEAFYAALDDCGLAKREIDSLLVARLRSYLKFCGDSGLQDLRYVNFQGSGGSQSGVAVYEAANLIRSGAADVVACVYGNHGRSIRMNYGGNPQPHSRYDDPYGMTSTGAYYGMLFRRHQHEFGTSDEALAAVSTSNRANALRNPNAVMQRPMSRDDYYASAMVTDPLRLFDYCMVNDGGVAYVVTTLERARDLKKPPVRILSTAVAGVLGYFWGADDCWYGALDSIRARVFEPAGLAPADIDTANIYDNFTPAVLFAIEGMGLCGRGESGDWLTRGHHRSGGSLPLNTSGGHLSESYMQGWSLTVESVRQVRGEAGIRQVADCNVALDITCSPVCSAAAYSL